MQTHKLKSEIGGYFELETYGAGSYHKNAIYLNSGRNSLRYIIRAYGIKTLFVPYYTCPVVWESIKAENCDIFYYDIDINFLPSQELPDDVFILVNNYFGICDNNILKLKKRYRNLIIDNAQSFYSAPCGIASFYSPRKFFGLPDGGILYCGKGINEQLEKDVSFENMSHLLKRHDLGANQGYEDFKNNDHSLLDQPIKQMSELSKALMSNINYERVRTRRNENFNFLRDKLDEINELELPDNVNAPMVYPLLIKNEGLRHELISKRIYVARYWDGIKGIAPHLSFTDYLREYLLPLPIDQRYTILDMQRIVESIMTKA